MAANSYLPNSYSSTVFQTRSSPGGINARLAQTLASMKHASFSQAEVGEHFFRHYDKNWSENYGFRDANSRPFTSNVFGEIAGYNYGTFLTAQGNHYPGNDPAKVYLHPSLSRAYKTEETS